MDNALSKTSEIPYRSEKDKCAQANDKGDYWEIFSSAPGCMNCEGKIEKQTGNIKDIQCSILNTCNE